jgi:hypothetical protein
MCLVRTWLQGVLERLYCESKLFANVRRTADEGAIFSPPGFWLSIGVNLLLQAVVLNPGLGISWVNLRVPWQAVHTCERKSGH